MTNQYDFLLKKTLRSVDALRLWGENPRLNPSDSYTFLSDFAEEMTFTDADKRSFINLAKSIASRGFIPADPIVVWQDPENKKYYVAEGNRRTLVLKLLREPHKAPKSLSAVFNSLSQKIDTKTIAKVPVSVAPTFDDAEWYISQRNSISSLQKRWSSEQQKRWVMKLYDKYDGDIKKVQTRIDLSESELKSIVRILKLKSYISELKDLFSKEEFEKAISIRFPITTFERFFNSQVVRDAWGIVFEDYDYSITSNINSFNRAFAEVIKRMIIDNGEQKYDSRILGTSSKILAQLKTLPQVTFGHSPRTDDNEADNGGNVEGGSESGQQTNTLANKENDQEEDSPNGSKPNPPVEPKNSPHRKRLVHESYTIHSDEYRIVEIFEELKKIPFKYPNAIAASMRIFLDLTVLNFITFNGLEAEICRVYSKGIRDIILRQRLEFIKQNHASGKVLKVIERLINPTNQYSLDVLNGYQHSPDHHFIQKEFLNKFWDSLFPLFEFLVDIDEN